MHIFDCHHRLLIASIGSKHQRIMSETAEEIERLQVERVQLQSTIQRVLDFPKRIDYECMVPVSKMGFMPGKIIHTNEFLLTPDSHTTKASSCPADVTSGGKWHSYTETAEVLMNRVADIDRKIGASKIISRKQTTFPSVSSSDRVSKESKVANEIKSHVSAPVPANHLSSEKYVEKGYSDEDEINSQQNGIEGVFEIREFIDSDGKEIKNEIVNLQEEMEEMEKKIGSLTATDNDGTSPVLSSDQEKILNSASFINQLSSDIKGKTLQKPEPQHSEFDYAGQRGKEIEVLDRLDDLEKEEEEWLAESEAAIRIRQLEKEYQAKALPEASLGGWKKGFFSKSGPQPVKSEPSKATLPPSSASAATKPVLSGEPNGKLKISQPRGIFEKKSVSITDEKLDSNKKAVSFQEILSPVKEHRAATKPVVISKAFTGSVMERFP